MHEATHRLSTGLFKGLYGDFLNEGVTQHFADMILGDEGLSPFTGHSYGPQLTDGQKMIAKAGGWELVAQVYFQGSQDAHKEILVRLKLIKDAKSFRAIHTDEILKAVRAP